MHPLRSVRRTLSYRRDYHGAGGTGACLTLNQPTPNKNVSRRGFVQITLGWLAATFAVGASAIASVRFLVPNVLYEPSLLFKAGKPDDFPDTSVTFMEDERVFLVRHGNTFRCLSAARSTAPKKATIARATAACLTTRAKSKAARLRSHCLGSR